MAGGMGRGREHPAAFPQASRPPRRHCWVIGAEGAPGPHPGLVLGWERRSGDWFALVSYYLEPDEVLVQQWLPSALVRPAT